MKKLLVLQLLLLSTIAAAQTRDFTRWVNPFIGTGGHGHTFPGATLPFGMVQLSPDTRIDNWDGSSGYHYSDDVIYGFSHTHLSGTGIPDGCDILFMPTADSDRQFGNWIEYKGGKYIGFSSTFSHADEVAEPGYYSVRLDDRKLLAELTATTRVGLHRYTFPKSTTAGIDLDLLWRDKTLGRDVKVIGNRRVEGFRKSASWARNQTVYFVAEFSKAFKGYGSGRPSQLGDDKDDSIFFGFDTKEGEKILLKVAISYVSIEGARKNLEAELPGWDFDKVRADAKAKWNKELSKIEVSGGTDDQTTIFYTELYHTMIHPNVFNDVDGNYRGHDKKVHQLPAYAAQPPYLRRSSASPEGSVKSGGSAAAPTRRQSRGSITQSRKSGAFPQIDGQSPPEHYTVFSLWDTFRAAHPLYTIIDQKRTVDFINTFIRIYEQGGRLPVWELWGEETDTMIGYHAVSVIADAMAKGIEGFDYEKAYEAAKRSAELDHFGLAAYKKRGYISSEDENESVSKTLEYAYNDWCIARIGKLLCEKRNLPDCRDYEIPEINYKTRYHRDGQIFGARSNYYQNVFDTNVDFMRPRRNGGWLEPFQPNEVTFHFTEGNSWQYSFFVPHDILGLVQLYGGRNQFGKKLDELFTTEQKLIGREQPDITGLIGQYAHGNEPSHHIPYLFKATLQPSKTEKYVRQIMDRFYTNAPDGLIGNEDCGQMSAWFVLSAMGFYPVTPGLPEYAIGTPLFKEVKINLENGKTFTIKAPQVSDKNYFVKSVTLNGHQSLVIGRLEHAAIMNGGVLEFDMTATAQPFGLKLGLINLGKGRIDMVPAVPVISGSPRIFRDTALITMSTHTSWGATIHYTLDGSEPSPTFNKYSSPIRIDRNTTVKAITVRGESRSPVAEAVFSKNANDWKVLSTSGYSDQYTGGGDDAIIDGLRGTPNFAAGEWQGYQGKTFDAVIDLQKEIEIRSLGGSFLQVVRSWIWMPDRLEFEVSNDGVTFTKVAEIKTHFPQQQMEPATREFSQTISPTRARYVRVRAYNIGKIPAWHPGAGGDPWIFVDEIFVR